MQKANKQSIEEFIRAGDQNKALSLLNCLNLKQIKRSDAYDYARFARRLRHFHLALKILNPIVRPKTPGSSPPKANEIIEYAASIRGLGAPAEALELLNPLDSLLHPEVLLERSFNHFAQWNYSSAVPLLEAYIQSKDIGDYARTIGAVNLCSAYLGSNQFKAAEKVLTQLLDETSQNAYSQLHFNCQEMMAQVQIRLHKDFEGALVRLNQAMEEYQGQPDDISLLFAKKWRAISSSLLSNEVSSDFHEVRKQAETFKHWETIRELDFYQAKITGDREKLVYLYFGTPFPSYRQRIINILGDNVIPIYFSKGSISIEPKILLETGSISGNSDIIPSGSVLHQLLILLNQDFYRPIPLLTLFSKLYPDQHFCPQTSANRVHQNVCRLRKVLSKNQIPLIIEENGGNYQLSSESSVSIVIPKTPLYLDRVSLLSKKLHSEVKGDSFDTKQACKILNMSKSNVQRLLADASDQDIVIKKGQGRSSYYQFKKVF